MAEKLIYLEGVDPVDFYGVNNVRFNKFIELFPDIKIVQRGNEIRISGEKKRLLEKGTESLAWEEVVRLLHLTCTEMFSEGLVKKQLMCAGIDLKESLDASPGDNKVLIQRPIVRLCSEASP